MARAWELTLCYMFLGCCVTRCSTAGVTLSTPESSMGDTENSMGNASRGNLLSTKSLDAAPADMEFKGSEEELCEMTIAGPKLQFVEFGSPVFWNCTATTTCAVVPGMGWETSLTKQINRTGRWITLSSTMDEWDTKAVCYTFSTGGNVFTTQIAVIAYLPPEDVRINIPQLMEVSQSYELTCDVKNIAPKRNLVVLIKRGNETLHRELYASDHTNGSTSVTVSYHITAQREDHEAEYTCLAQLDLRPNGKLFERSSNTIVRVISLPEDPKIDVPGVIERGSNVTIKCKVANAIPIEETQIRLILKDEVLTNTMELRNGDVKSAEAVVLAAEPGNYSLECRARVGDMVKTVKKELLFFNFPDPVLQILPKRAELPVGTEVNVICDVVETYPREVQLSIQIGTLLEPCEMESPSSCTYTLMVQKEHVEVTAACEATMRAANLTRRTSKTLNVVYGPEFSDSLCPSAQTVVEGHNTIFFCKADGNPAPTVTCSKDGTVGAWRQTGRNDSGTLNCTATNSIGVSVRVVKVTIEYKPRITLFIRGPENIEKGHNLTLECLADGLPAPEYIWTTPKGADIIYSSDNRTLTITSATSHHSGSYICEARNRHGSDTQQKEIKVADTLPLILGLVLASVALVVAVTGGVAYYLWNRARKIRKYESQKSKQKAKKPATRDSLLPQENKVLPFEIKFGCKKYCPEEDTMTCRNALTDYSHANNI
ncbi:intercellular adhesion molecule 1-like isoform X2 [Lissotriton helveticus]